MKFNLRKFIGNKEFMKSALTVAIPLMFQQLVTSSVNLIDNMQVGQLGDAALGGVAAVNRYYMIATFGTNGVLAAAAIFIAQYFGAKNMQKTKESFRFSILCAFAIMIPFALTGLLKPEVIVKFFTDDAAILKQGVDYMGVAAYTFFPMALSLSINNAFRACGETKKPLVIGILTALCNTMFNYILIFGHFGAPALGVRGAALATLIARLFEMITLLIVLKLSEMPFKTKVKNLLKFPFELGKRIMIKAAPLALNEVLWSSGMAMLFKFYSTRGPEVMSGYSVAGTTSDLFYVLFGGMAVASNVLISQELGANHLDEARDNGYRLLGFSTMLAVVFGIGMFTTSYLVPPLYNVSETARFVASSMLKIQGVMFWIYMFTCMCYFILRAGGDTKNTLLMDSVFMWTVNLPFVCACTYLTDLPIVGLYLAGQAADFLKLIISYKMVSKEKWVRNLTEGHQ
ncbi:MAG: MATE family efflux transporter [Erysipelotrichaceae bacterium]|nr:MATE family efflux transporter [Erysipelotrichaceae bacterium]